MGDFFRGKIFFPHKQARQIFFFCGKTVQKIFVGRLSPAGFFVHSSQE